MRSFTVKRFAINTWAHPSESQNKDQYTRKLEMAMAMAMVMVMVTRVGLDCEL